MINKTRIYRLIGLVGIAMIVAACGGGSTEPTAEPMAIPTEIDDLRFATTEIPAGLPGNPLQMVIQPVQSELYVEPEVTQEPGVGEVLLPASSTQPELDLEEAILEYSNVTVDIVPVAKPVDALQALCGATDTVSAVWVDGVSFSAALAQNCGEPIYIVQRRIDGSFESGEGGLVLVSRQQNNPSLAGLNNGIFCRLGVDDFYSWLLPLMIFRANNINPSNFEAIVDYDSTEEMVDAVLSGECTGAGLSVFVYEEIVGDDTEAFAEQVSVAFNTPPIPYAVLMYPVEIQLGIRVALNEGLQELVEDDDANALLQLFLGQDRLRLVDRDDFAEYEAFLQTVGLDFAILGN